MNNHEANVLSRELNDPTIGWPIGEVKTYSDMHEVFQFMRYGWPIPADVHNAYLDITTVPHEVLVAGGWENSTAGYLSAHLYQIQGDSYVALTPMHGHPLVVVRLGCAHDNRTVVRIGRYAHDYTCNVCGYKWCIDSGD